MFLIVQCFSISSEGERYCSASSLHGAIACVLSSFKKKTKPHTHEIFHKNIVTALFIATSFFVWKSSIFAVIKYEHIKF
jgi:hypothetical protein